MKETSIVVTIVVAILAIVLIAGLLVALVDGVNNDTESWFDSLIEFFGGSSESAGNKGESNKDSEKYDEGDPACSHTWDTGTVVKKATCTAVGELKRTCTKCGREEKEEIPLADHLFDKYENAGADGHFMVCVCGARESSDPVNHVITKTETTPNSCEKAGSTIVYCLCGHKTVEEGYKLPHVGDSFVKVNETTHRYVCLLCAQTFTETHEFGVATTVRNATCYEFGLRTKECLDCKFVLEETIMKLPHNLTETVVVPATCSEPGSKHVTCENEGCSYSQTVVIPKVPHNYGFEKANDFEHIYYCSDCGDQYSEACVYPSGYEFHDEEWHIKYCSICGYEHMAKHSYVFVGTVNKPDHTVWSKYSCSGCGHSYEKDTGTGWA